MLRGLKYGPYNRTREGNCGASLALKELDGIAHLSFTKINLSLKVGFGVD
jgi:hypothetical protein